MLVSYQKKKKAMLLSYAPDIFKFSACRAVTAHVNVKP